MVCLGINAPQRLVRWDSSPQTGASTWQSLSWSSHGLARLTQKLGHTVRMWVSSSAEEEDSVDNRDDADLVEDNPSSVTGSTALLRWRRAYLCLPTTLAVVSQPVAQRLLAPYTCVSRSKPAAQTSNSRNSSIPVRLHPSSRHLRGSWLLYWTFTSTAKRKRAG